MRWHGVVTGLLTIICAVNGFAEDGASDKNIAQIDQLHATVAKLNSLLPNDTKNTGKLLKILEDQARSRDLTCKYAARHAVAAYYLKYHQDHDAWKLVKDCAESSKLQGVLDKDYGSSYLCCYLDAAMCKLRQQKPQDALQMLFRAESMTQDFDKVLVKLKYAEILQTPEIDQTDKAADYLRQAQSECDRRIAQLSDTSTVAGQAKARNDALPQWEALRNDINKTATELENAQLKKQYGEDYAAYVKMRRLYRSGLSEEAGKLCAEIVKANKGKENVYVAAAKLLEAKCALSDRRLDPKERIKRADAQLKKFVKEQPYGLYRGEAWMELGRIALEQNWDVVAASKYYEKALEWFRYVRNLHDAMDLYTVPAKVQDVSKPQGKYTSLDQWKRTIYRAEGDREIINQKTAPWYLSEQEKKCLFRVGFLRYFNEDYTGALECWKTAGMMDENIVKLKKGNWPNALMRLEAAAEYHQMMYTPEEKKLLKNKKIKLQLQTAEFYYLLEEFNNMKRLCDDVLRNPVANKYEQAAANLGIGTYYDMISASYMLKERERIAAYFRRAQELGRGSPFEEEGLIRMAFYYQASSTTWNMGKNLIDEYLKKYPRGRYIDKIKFREGIQCLYKNDHSGAKNTLTFLEQYYPKSEYTISLKEKFYDP